MLGYADADVMLMLCYADAMLCYAMPQYPGYCLPSLTPIRPDWDQLASYFAAEKGDRVVETDFRAKKHKKHGTITRVSDDNDTEVSVYWDEGSSSGMLRCGKRGLFELVYE
eukprot:g50061.t1